VPPLYHVARELFRLINVRAGPTEPYSSDAQLQTEYDTLSAQKVVMTSYRADVRSVSDLCTHVKHLGYATSRRIRLYGEEFQVVSDPFPEANGVAVHVTTKKDSSIRVLRIPATVLQRAKGRRVPSV